MYFIQPIQKMPFGEKHARFGDSKSRMEDRSRVLTMKYGKHQMALIRKRMKVENWIETEVTKLFNGNETNVGYSYSCHVY